MSTGKTPRTVRYEQRNENRQNPAAQPIASKGRRGRPPKAKPDATTAATQPTTSAQPPLPAQPVPATQNIPQTQSPPPRRSTSRGPTTNPSQTPHIAPDASNAPTSSVALGPHNSPYRSPSRASSASRHSSNRGTSETPARSQSPSDPSRHSSSIPGDSSLERLAISSSTPPPNPPAPVNDDTTWFKRKTLASASFDVPKYFQRMINTHGFLFEYKRLSPLRGSIPFDVYTLRLCGVHDSAVFANVRAFVPPHAVLHRCTLIHAEPDSVHEGYRKIPDHSYDGTDAHEEDDKCIADAKLRNYAIYDIWEFSFHLGNDLREVMDFFVPAIQILYHVMLTYIRYLVTVYDILPFLGSCSFWQRMMLRFGCGLLLSCICSSPVILGQALFGIFLQWLCYIPTSATPEIRDRLKLLPFYVWLIIEGFFYWLAKARQKRCPQDCAEDTLLSKKSFHKFWDLIGVSMDPFAIAIKLVVTYVFYYSVVHV